MQTHYVFVLLAVAAVVNGYNSEVPQCVSTLQKEWQTIGQNTNNFFDKTKKDVQNREKDLEKALKDELKANQKSFNAKKEDELENAKKQGKEKGDEKIIDGCVKEHQGMYVSALEANFNKQKTCVNETTKKTLEDIEKAEKIFKEKFNEGPLSSQESLFGQNSCKNVANYECLQKGINDSVQQLEDSDESSSETISTTKKLKEEHITSTANCFNDYLKGVEDVDKRHQDSVNHCTKPEVLEKERKKKN